MSIYTKTGDNGTTSLANGVRVPKTDIRLEAYGTADELNSFVGWLRSHMEEQERLEWIQNKLFNLGAQLSEAPGEWITDADVHRVEQWIDAIQAELPPLRAFILPGGNEAVSLCHVCRTITRRLERLMVAMEAPRLSREFVNRLSDFFFVLSREVAKNANISLYEWQKV